MAPETPIAEPIPAQVEEHLNGGNPVIKAMRNVLMAAIGTVTLGVEEVEAIVNHLIERGELAEKDGRAMIADLRERRHKEVEKEAEEVQEVVEKSGSRFDGLVEGRVEAILSRMNIPSRGDIEALTTKIGDLSEKVDELTKKLAA